MIRTCVLSCSLLALSLALASCKDSAAPKEKPKAKEPSAAPAAAEPAPSKTEEAPAAAEVPAEEPLPTSPEELELARKTAILEGRYEDVVRFCSAEDLGAKDEQAVLSCVLSACRLSDVEKAQTWAKSLTGNLKKQARDVCKASNVPL